MTHLSISNIAWDSTNDAEMYEFITAHGFTGLEIAPTRIFPDKPYEHLAKARIFADTLGKKFGLAVSSLQSIWYGRNESMFGPDTARETLIEYTQKAVLFAEVIGCGNLVFGSPKNRAIPGDKYIPSAVDFFQKIGEFAHQHGAVIAIEPNPPYYNTNFINTTDEAFAFCRQIDYHTHRKRQKGWNR